MVRVRGELIRILATTQGADLITCLKELCSTPIKWTSSELLKEKKTWIIHRQQIICMAMFSNIKAFFRGETAPGGCSAQRLLRVPLAFWPNERERERERERESSPLLHV